MPVLLHRQGCLGRGVFFTALFSVAGAQVRQETLQVTQPGSAQGITWLTGSGSISWAEKVSPLTQAAGAIGQVPVQRKRTLPVPALSH